MKIPFSSFANLPDKFQLVITVDRENGTLDFEIVDSADDLAENHEIVTGTDELNLKLKEGWRLIEVLRPRVPPLSFLIERPEKTFAENMADFTHSVERRPFD